VREAAAVAQCRNNLHEIALSLHGFQDDHGAFPSAVLPHPDLSSEQRLSWQVAVLPYLEQGALYSQMRTDEAWDAGANRNGAATSLRCYKCPGNANEAGPGQPAFTHYVGMAGVGTDAAELPAKDPRAGFFGHSRGIGSGDIKDGLSYTIAVIETASENGPWAAGGPATVRGLDPEAAPYVGPGRPFGTAHNVQQPFLRRPLTTANVALADGSARTITDGVSATTLQALATIAGQDDVGDDF
jgi:hypothetical protein